MATIDQDESDTLAIELYEYEQAKKDRTAWIIDIPPPHPPNFLSNAE